MLNCQTFYLDVILCEGHLNGQEGQGINDVSICFLDVLVCPVALLYEDCLAVCKGCYRRIITIGGCIDQFRSSGCCCIGGL